MNSTPRALQWIIWGALAATIGIIVAAFIITESRKSTRPDQPSTTESGSAGTELPVLFQVPPFVLTNQAGELVTRDQLLGHPWIADIIFTRCAGPCPEMTRRMAELQAVLPPASPVRFVTLTANPEFDTPAVLQAYARRHAAQPGRWHFLTGTKRQIVELAVDGLKFTALDKEESKRENLNDLFIHSTSFIVIDRRGRARAVIESDDPAMKLKALSILQQLLDEK